MQMQELNYYYNKLKFGENIFHNLMQNQIKDILLVSTFYDAFIFEQDGRLSEEIFGEYRQLNLSIAPKITSIPSGKKALQKIEEFDYDLVILMMRIGEITPFDLSRMIKAKRPGLPVLLLLNVQSDLAIVDNNRHKMDCIDEVFLWNGDTKLFLAMVKTVEDRLNAAHDTEVGLTRVILLVEDSVYYYSIFLPLLYSLIMRQTQMLINQELTEINKRLRMRARPKILLAHCYEEALEIYEKQSEYLICVISDVKFHKNNRLDQDAGLKLIRYIKERDKDISLILHSSDISNKDKAKKVGAYFIDKNSKKLLYTLKNFVVKKLGFGNFIFRDSNNKILAKVSTIKEFEPVLKAIPDESLVLHGKTNDFSNWLIAHGEVVLAKKIRPIKVTDFKTVDELRHFLLQIFTEVRQQKNRGNIIEFDPDSLMELDQVIRMGEGSLGGKGRGLAFLNALLVTMQFENKFTKTAISLPSTSIIGTHEFDLFIDNLSFSKRIDELEDREIDRLFLNGNLSSQLVEKLKIFVEKIHYPIAVRSSSLLEDSQSHPFAGIYRTIMLPNNHPDKRFRLKQIMDAIKLVYASVFLKKARSFLENLHYGRQEEKMAVILQEIAGRSHSEHLYFPHISGTVRSYNYSSNPYIKNSDGMAFIALGLGKTVIEGEKHYQFCPAYPNIDLLHRDEILENLQKEFYAINMSSGDFDLSKGDDITLVKVDTNTAEKEGFFKELVPLWGSGNKHNPDNLSQLGLRVLAFNGILKLNTFPLAEILCRLLQIGEIALGAPVELEFAADLYKDEQKDTPPALYILQIRPLSTGLKKHGT